MFSYNIPELMVKKVDIAKSEIATVLRNSKGVNVTVKGEK
jgi:hypothetical protein